MLTSITQFFGAAVVLMASMIAAVEDWLRGWEFKSRAWIRQLISWSKFSWTHAFTHALNESTLPEVNEFIALNQLLANAC